jgi:AraC-like DNA-binding protein
MELKFAAPDPLLRRAISAHYYFRADYPVIEDFERADVGYLRFMQSGTGHYHFRDGRMEPSYPVLLIGPGNSATRYSVNGPLHTLGCALLPDFWCSIVDASAADHADRSVDGTFLLGQGAQEVFDRVATMSAIEDMVPIVESFLLSRLKPTSPENRKTIDTIGAWLSSDPIPSVEDLYAAMEQSPRQVMRLANRFFGAPPKLLARKYRALRTASAIVGTNGKIPESAIAQYSDHSHLIREVKYFTGMTPRQLQINRNPIVKTTLQPANFNRGTPWT